MIFIIGFIIACLAAYGYIFGLTISQKLIVVKYASKIMMIAAIVGVLVALFITIGNIQGL